MFGFGSSTPRAVPDVVKITLNGCSPRAGGVGIDLTHNNTILEIRPNTAAAAALAAGNGFEVGDRVIAVDGVALNGVFLTEVIVPAESHIFEVERTQGWAGFSIEDTQLEEDEDGFKEISRLRTVVVQKIDGQLGLNPEVRSPNGQDATIQVAKVYPGSRASSCGMLSVGDVIKSINGQPLACSIDDNPLQGAAAVLSEVRDGEDISLEIESDVLLGGYIQKKGEKSFLGSKASWQRRFMILVWSDTVVSEREIRYFEGQDYNSRKQKGAIDLTRATAVSQKEIDGAAGLTIDTPGRLWELLPEGREAAVEWYRTLNMLLQRRKGLQVVASMSNAVDEMILQPEGQEDVPGELTLRLHRKLGMSINKLGNEIVVAELEPDGAAAACGLLSAGDAIDEVNGMKTESCRQTIKLLTANASAAQLKIFSKVVHGGWMHKLGEGLGGWTTRYFTLTYELDPSALPSGNTTKVADKLDAKRERPRATSVAAGGVASSRVLVNLHKANRSEKLGISHSEVKDADGTARVVVQRIYEGYVASLSAGLMIGDVILSINGVTIESAAQAHQLLTDANGAIELQVLRAQECGCWMLRYYDAKNSSTRTEKGCIKLSRGTIREINKYTLQEADQNSDEVPRIGMYILQDERCWELLPPEEELNLWVSKLQLAVFGQEVIGAEYATVEKGQAAAEKVRDLKGAHFLTLQQQYGLVLATYKDRDVGNATGGAAVTTYSDRPVVSNVYIMSLEMDGAGACSGFLSPDDRLLEVDGMQVESLQSATRAFRESRGTVKVKVSSRVVHGGWLYKKGEVNTSLQLRWFLLYDEPSKDGGSAGKQKAQGISARSNRSPRSPHLPPTPIFPPLVDVCMCAGGGSVLRYFEGRNAVSRVAKGEIKINPTEVSMVRTFTYESGGEKRMGVRITTTSRVWELVAHKSDAEARRWAELLNSRIRKRGRALTAAAGGAVVDVTDAQHAATVGSAVSGVVPQSTRL